MQLVDTHVHINFPDFQDDLEEVRLRWQAAGVSHLVHSCVEPTEFLTIQGIAHCFPELSFAVGLHPLSASQWTEQMGETITHLAQSDHRVVAIGETGLDYYKSDHHEGQRKAFWAQLEIAHSLNLPVIIHCREASEDMITILHQFLENMGSVTGVMHCWGGTPEQMASFLKLGFYISFSGTVTFKKSELIQASARQAPSDRILIETDCPFLAPVPKRGNRNEPAFVYHVAHKLAELRGVSIEQLAHETTTNALRLFNLNPTQTTKPSPSILSSNHELVLSSTIRSSDN